MSIRPVLFILLFYLISTSSTTKITLYPTDPVDQVSEVTVSEGFPLTIQCATSDGKPPGWLYNGANDNVVLALDNGKFWSRHIPSFNPRLHSGFYECFEFDSQRSAAVRIFPRAQTLPKGYRPCPEEDSDYCENGQCGIHRAFGHKDCFCYSGWYGKRCDRANVRRKRRF